MVLVGVHPKHVLLEGVGEELALAKSALNLVLSPSRMLAHVVVPHRFGVQDLVAQRTAFSEFLLFLDRNVAMFLRVMLLQVSGLHILQAQLALVQN